MGIFNSTFVKDGKTYQKKQIPIDWIDFARLHKLNPDDDCSIVYLAYLTGASATLDGYKFDNGFLVKNIDFMDSNDIFRSEYFKGNNLGGSFVVAYTEYKIKAKQYPLLSPGFNTSNEELLKLPSIEDVHNELNSELEKLSLFETSYAYSPQISLYAIYQNYWILMGKQNLIKSTLIAFPLSLSDNKKKTAKEFLKEMEIKFDGKLDLAYKHYRYAFEVGVAGNISFPFLLFAMCLEILYGDSNTTTDIKYRVSRNAAVFLGEEIEDSRTIYKQVSLFYKIRSEIVHNGKSKKLSNDILLSIAELCRKSIIYYFFYVRVSENEFTKQLTENGFGSNPFKTIKNSGQK
jgi:hypothetical protein